MKSENSDRNINENTKQLTDIRESRGRFGCKDKSKSSSVIRRSKAQNEPLDFKLGGGNSFTNILCNDRLCLMELWKCFVWLIFQ